MDKTKGCLNGKSEKEKKIFFASLFNFIKTDLVFYNEQLHDLQPHELDEFNEWIDTY